MNNTKNIILKHGILAGIIIAAVMLSSAMLADLSNINLMAGFIIGTSSMIVAFLLLIPALQKINLVNPQTFKLNLLYCLAIVLVAAIVYSLAWTIYINFINPEIIQDLEKAFLDQAKADNLSGADLTKAKEDVATMIARYTSPVQTFLWTLLEPTPAGFLLTIIASLIQRSRNRKSAISS